MNNVMSLIADWLTISLFKADIGSICGHTLPAKQMLKLARKMLKQAKKDGLILDFWVGHTGDDVGIILTHTHGKDAEAIHVLVWDVFMKLGDLAEEMGLYGHHQDMLGDVKSSGNVRGMGPGAAEIEVDLNLHTTVQFLALFADKCGPGAFNLPIIKAFTSTQYNTGLWLPNQEKGFDFRIIDMEHTGGDSTVVLPYPERKDDIELLLHQTLRFGVQAINSRLHPDMQIVAVTADRLHSAEGSGGQYLGKDDPGELILPQSLNPAVEELLAPFEIAHYVFGGARGRQVLSLMPMAINSGVLGSYCQPIVSCIGFSVVKATGKLIGPVDFFGDVAWDDVRRKARQKSNDMREQSPFGPASIPSEEAEYHKSHDKALRLLEEFKVS